MHSNQLKHPQNGFEKFQKSEIQTSAEHNIGHIETFRDDKIVLAAGDILQIWKIVFAKRKLCAHDGNMFEVSCCTPNRSKTIVIQHKKNQNKQYLLILNRKKNILLRILRRIG